MWQGLKQWLRRSKMSRLDSVFAPSDKRGEDSPLFRARTTPNAPIPAHILPTLEHLETQATSTLNTDLENVFGRIVQQSDSLVSRKDIKSILELNQGLGVALQRPILALWEQGWLSGSEHAIAEMQNAVPQGMRSQAEQFDLGTDIKRAIRGLFQLTARTFRNLGAERAVQKRALKLAGNFSKDILDGVKADLLAAIMPQPDTGTPISREDLLKRLQGRLGVSKVRAGMIARTETTNAYNQGRLSSYRDSTLVTHLLFLSIHDHRTTDICQSRANMILPVEDKRAIALNTPPLHVQCRSVVSPLLSVNPRHQTWIEDESRLYFNRKLVPLPKGWRTAT
jgi:SPP1 gp7 family putative phage head morphogenesis protein